jgi:hypothetical protein
MALQHLRSSTANKRPLPAGMSDGQLAINTNLASPGLFLKNSNGDLVKVGPVHVGTTAPNASPAAGGETGNTTGELWLDTSLTPNELKTWNGSAWVSATGQEIPVSKLIDGSARQLLQTDAAGTGVEWTSNVDVPGTLDVTSTATFDSIASHPLGSAGAPTITFTGDTNTGIYSPGADQVAISTGGSGRLFVDASGNVGINTSPSSLGSSVTTLEIKGGSTARSGGLRVSSSDSSVKAAFYIYDGAGVLGTESATPLDLYTGNSPRLRITSAGLVGVGTSSVTHALTVTTAGTDAVKINTADYGYLDLSNGTSTVRLQNVANVPRIGTATNHPLVFAVNEIEGMRLTSTGLGVGTTSPGAPLEVNGTVICGRTDGSAYIINRGGYSSSTVYSFWGNDTTGISNPAAGQLGFLAAGSERLRIDSSGRVGIGTSSPGALFDVSGGGGNGRFQVSPTPGVVYYNTLIGSGGYASAINDATQHIWYVGGAEAARINNNGQLGIGTTSPGAQLSVYGDSVDLVQAYIENNNAAGASGSNRRLMLAHGGTTASSIAVWQNAGVVEATGAGGGLALGAYSAASTDPIKFYTGPGRAERARIDGSGRLLVGTSTSAGGDALQQTSGVGSSTRPKLQLFHWEAGDGAAQLIFSKSRGSSFGSYTVVNSGDELGGLFFQGSNGSAFGTGARIDAVADAAWGSGDHPSRLVFSTTADGASSPTERMRITNSGAVAIGDTSGATRLVVKGEETLSLFTNTTATTATFRTTMSLADGFGTERGSIKVSTTGTQFNTSSDYRLKENVLPVSDGITRLRQLKPSRFNFIGSADTVVDGFIAHEVQTVVPEAVAGTKDEIDAEGNPKYQGIDQSKLVPLLTAALQEAVAKIESLEARLTAAGI